MALALIYRLLLASMLLMVAGTFTTLKTTTDGSTTYQWTDRPSTDRPYPWTDNSNSTWYWTSTPTPGQDLTGRMFSMSPDSSVALQGFNSYQNTYAFTVCLRAIFEMTSTRNIFSLSIGTSVALSLSTSPLEYNSYQLTLGQASKAFKMVSKVPSVGKLWPWTSLCVTWDSTTGMTQLWEDNSMSVRKSMWRGQSFYGTPVLSLSGFEGQVTDMHMWSQAMPVSVLRSYNQGWGYPQGTMLSWARTSYSGRGSPILEKAYESLAAAASEGKDEGAEEQKKEAPVRRSWRWKQGKMGNVVQEGAENKYGCLGQRKRCGRKTL